MNTYRHQRAVQRTRGLLLIGYGISPGIFAVAVILLCLSIAKDVRVLLAGPLNSIRTVVTEVTESAAKTADTIDNVVAWMPHHQVLFGGRLVKPLSATSLGNTRDGDLDAYLANGAGDGDQVWLNDGRGHFSNSGQTLGTASTLEVALGDVDGDGDLDAFAAKHGANKVWLNDGQGVFSVSGQRLGNRDSGGVALGDLDSDGDLDAFVANSGSVARPDTVWLNDGYGRFTDSGQM